MPDFKEGDHPRDDDGQFTAGGGSGGGSGKDKRVAMRNALKKLAKGSTEAIIPNLRDDLEKYGGSNDITFMRGNEKGGIIHLFKDHPKDIDGVLGAVAYGKVIEPRSAENIRENKVEIERDGYRAVLALDYRRKKKTWLLTGYKDRRLTKDAGESVGWDRQVLPSHDPTHAEPSRSRFDMGADSILAEILASIAENARGNSMQEDIALALDAESSRRLDENGFLHVLDNPVSKVQVARYFGREIPGWQALALDPDAAYMLLRPAEELEKAAPTINRLPIELMHHDTDADNLPKQQIIGSKDRCKSFCSTG